MDDKKAAEILIKLLKKYSLNEDEREALRKAIGILGWTHLAASRIKNIKKARQVKEVKNTKW